MTMAARAPLTWILRHDWWDMRVAMQIIIGGHQWRVAQYILTWKRAMAGVETERSLRLLARQEPYSAMGIGGSVDTRIQHGDLAAVDRSIVSRCFRHPFRRARGTLCRLYASGIIRIPSTYKEDVS